MLLGIDVLPEVMSEDDSSSSILAVKTRFGHAFMGTYEDQPASDVCQSPEPEKTSETTVAEKPDDSLQEKPDDSLQKNNLITCGALVAVPTEQTTKGRVPLDSGTDMSSVTSQAAKELELQPMDPEMTVAALGGLNESVLPTTHLSLLSYQREDWNDQVPAVTSNQMFTPQPEADASVVEEQPQVKGLIPADPPSYDAGRIDVPPETDALPCIQDPNGPRSSITAVETALGHEVMGTDPPEEDTVQVEAEESVTTQVDVPKELINSSSDQDPVGVKLPVTFTNFNLPPAYNDRNLPVEEPEAAELLLQEYPARESYSSNISQLTAPPHKTISFIIPTTTLESFLGQDRPQPEDPVTCHQTQLPYHCNYVCMAEPLGLSLIPFYYRCNPSWNWSPAAGEHSLHNYSNYPDPAPRPVASKHLALSSYLHWQ